MRFVLLSALVICFFVATGNAQTPRTFRSQEVVFDNGSGKTDTVKFAGSVNQMLDVSGLATTNGNLTLDTTLDMNHKNLLNGGSGSFTSLATNGMITANVTFIGNVPTYFIGGTEYLIVNNDIFPIPLIVLPSSVSSKGRILTFENPSSAPSFVILVEGISGDRINFSPGFYQLSVGAAVTLMSDGTGNWIKTN